MGKKATRVEIDERVNTVFNLLLNANNRQQILEYAKSTWGVGMSMTDQYIERARSLLKEDARQERHEFLIELLARSRETERKAMQTNQLGVVIAAQKYQASLLQFEMT